MSFYRFKRRPEGLAVLEREKHNQSIELGPPSDPKTFGHGFNR
jgi:hypothetical protein